MTYGTAPAPLRVTFQGGTVGEWRISSIEAVAGDGLPPSERLDVLEGREPSRPGVWALRGVTSNARYTVRRELDDLAASQAGLGRGAATCAALLPIRKSPAWWSLGQDERRSLFEEQSRHIRIGLDYLPAVARRLHHSRDLGEPFDFLTWFEFAPEENGAFDEMLRRLRATPEWRYVDREVDIRLHREPSDPSRGARSEGL